MLLLSLTRIYDYICIFFCSHRSVAYLGGDLGAMKINNGNETPYLSVRTSPFAIDHEHRTQTRTQTQTRTTEFGSNGDYSTFVEAVKWRRGQMLGKGAFGSVWLALREKVRSE